MWLHLKKFDLGPVDRLFLLSSVAVTRVLPSMAATDSRPYSPLSRATMAGVARYNSTSSSSSAPRSRCEISRTTADEVVLMASPPGHAVVTLLMHVELKGPLVTAAIASRLQVAHEKHRLKYSF